MRTMSMTMTTISLFLLLVSISTSVSASASASHPLQPLLRRPRGLCVSTLCRDDGDLICEYLCAALGDREGLEGDKNKNTKDHKRK
jgi:hypothetical protein